MPLAYPFHATAFVLPPWEVIYANNAERDQSFADAVDVHAKVVRGYRSWGGVGQPCGRDDGAQVLDGEQPTSRASSTSGGDVYAVRGVSG